MFKKILIAEDHESISISVQKTLEELGVPTVDYVSYCDDALAKVHKSIRENAPYDLLISDLYYEEDHHKQNIKNGKELVEEIRKFLPELKVIVFSGEHKSGIIDSLFKDTQINGYVRKARNDSKELKRAIAYVFANENHLSSDLKTEVKKLNSYEFTDYDITLVSLLAEGILQKNIPACLTARDLKPNSLSSVEKRLNRIKEDLQINSNQQLVAFCKDLGII